ncbi:MAG: bifunctional riboflavin kinase/FAD synthetase [Pseudomonadota bacterium]|nr:bifunctional riboflavin kinase/FAD synthetase [Pseudomonadota bacterium]
MKFFTYNKYENCDLQDLSVALGNFDGLHQGHKQVIELARPTVDSQCFGLITFEPHPRQFFSQSHDSFRLMNRRGMVLELEKMGLDVLIEIPFTNEISSLTAEPFVNQILHKYFDLKRVVVGEDFRFGKKRSGDATSLKNLCRKYGIETVIAETVKHDGTEISSTAIRNALSRGDTDLATKMLGRRYSIVGKVLDGDKRGHKLGYPTANISLDNLNLPKFGVYSAVIKIFCGKYKGEYKSVVSIGNRPTFGKNIPNLEAHIFNFSGRIYGQEISIELVKFQRDEVKFDNTEDLIKQMEEDCLIARRNLG